MRGRSAKTLTMILLRLLRSFSIGLTLSSAVEGEKQAHSNQLTSGRVKAEHWMSRADMNESEPTEGKEDVIFLRGLNGEKGLHAIEKGGGHCDLEGLGVQAEAKGGKRVKRRDVHRQEEEGGRDLRSYKG